MGNKNVMASRKVTRSIFTWALLCVMAAGLFLSGFVASQASVSAADASVSTEKELLDAVVLAPTTAPGNTIPFVIEFAGDISLSSGTTLDIPAGANVTLTGNYNLVGANGQPTITVPSGAVATIDGITVTHAPGATGNSRGITIGNGGALRLTSGSISGNAASDGGGVFNDGGTFTMSGGSISGNAANRGGGIFNDGTFTLTGGTIGGSPVTKNSARSDGGGIYNAGSFAQMTMSGGTISYNSATGGGGVCNSGIYEMTAGTISGNYASGGGGVLNYNSFSMSGTAAITDNFAERYGGGVENNGSGAGSNTIFNMSSGSISGNTSGYSGGGMYNAYRAELNMSGTAVISGNSANTFGGGVSNWDNSLFNMSGGAIFSNDAAYGGGVFSYYGISVNMSGGAIYVNNATNSGGGVFNWENSTFNMSGDASIYNNDAAASGGGVANWANSASAAITFTMSNNASITGNCASNGGGIFINDVAPHNISIISGVISGNSATINGGGIWIAHDSLAQLNIGAGVRFSNNGAATMHNIADSDKPTYNAHVLCTNWSVPFEQGYNNYDVSYTNTPELKTVTFIQNHEDTDNTIIASVFVGEGTAIGSLFPNPSRTGYNLSGWNTTRDGSGITYSATSPVITGNLTLYAQWEEFEETKEFTLTYDANGATGTMEPSLVTYGVNFTLPANAFTRPGFTFSHWNTRANGTGTSWQNEWEFSPWEYASDMTFYAQWVPDNKFSVIYDGNGNTSGTAPIDINSLYLGGSMVTVLGQGNLARTGYTFLGWSTSATATSATYTAGATFTINSNVTLYAVWQALPTYRVTYNGNGNTSGTAPVDANNPYPAGSTVTVLGQGNLARTGYTLLGWATSATAMSASYTAGSTFTIYSNVTLYAVWRIIPPTTYTVTVDDSAASPNGSGSYEAGASVTIRAGSKAGYTFTGWTVVSGGVNVAGTATADFTMPARDVVVRANWEEIPTQPANFRVDVENSYADQNGSGTYDVDATVTIHAGTRDDGYVFVGWTVTSGGVTLADSRSPSTTFIMPECDVVIQAIWEYSNVDTGRDSTDAKWALLNLILCCIGAMVAVFILVRASILRHKKTNLLWLLLAVVAGIAGVVVFLITENMRNPMTFVDWWT
ncbi:MAG: InlB B-repeat-containing protein, partial [Dehalococcoidia bacterium]|nr:InlB B-repeat-containing protein [Dehalococcoidia bacterium]